MDMGKMYAYVCCDVSRNPQNGLEDFRFQGYLFQNLSKENIKKQTAEI
jgi:hypothetical protein